MAPSDSLWTAPSLQRYKLPIIAITCLAAGATIYYAQTLYSEPREPQNGLHRSNAGRRRRERRSQGAVPESEEYEGLDETLLATLGPAFDRRRGPLGLAETDADGVSEYSWEDQGESKDKEAQGLLLLLYKIAEEQSRTDSYVHRGVSCNSCNEHPIKGIRYRCANCADYDLCETCEAAHTHDREHLFWKIRIPAPHIGSSSKERLPLFYPGMPKAVIQNLHREKVEYFCKETGYKAGEVEALWEQFRSMAAAEFHDDPDHYGLAIDRAAFDKCFVPRSSTRPSSPNLLYSRIFSYYDTNNDGLIGFSEFITGLASLKRKNSAERLKRIFKAYDINDDGYVERRDFLRIFRAYYTLTKDLMSDIVSSLEAENDQDSRELVSSSQPISAGFNGPGLMQSDGRRIYDSEKARNSFGDIVVTDGMGVVRERRAGPQSELHNIVGDNAEDAYWGGKRSLFTADGSQNMTGQKIHDIVNYLPPQEVVRMLGLYGKDRIPSVPDVSNEEPWETLRRELQGLMALELLQRRNVRRIAIIQRLRSQSYYQDGDVTWISWDIVAPQDFGRLNADPKLHTQMEQHLRDIESSQLKGVVKNDLCELIKAFKWPINDTLGFGDLVLGLVKEGWTQEELLQGLDGYASRPSEVMMFVHNIALMLARRASQAVPDEQDFRAGPFSSKSSRLRLAKEEWSCPKDTGLKLKPGQDILLSVTEEALNELLDPVFKLRENLALIAMYERPRRNVFRQKIIAALPSNQRYYILKQSIDLYCRQWLQKKDPPTLGAESLEREAERFKKFLRFMLSGDVNSTNSSKCDECLKDGHESWVRIGETCSRTNDHSKNSKSQAEESLLDKRKPSFAFPEKCPDCAQVDLDVWISDLYCNRCGRPSTRVKKEEIKIRYSIESGGKSIIKSMSAEDSEASDDDESQDERGSLSANTHFCTSQPGSPKMLSDSTSLDFEDFDGSADALSDRMASGLRSRHPQGLDTPKTNGELAPQAGHELPRPQPLSSNSELQRPDPTLPQHRPTTVPSFCVLPPTITFSATAAGKQAERPADKVPEQIIKTRDPVPPSDSKLKFWMCLDILEGDDRERGGPGRINFEEFEELMQGEKGATLGFLASWVDIGTF